jgi:hypothetical protein
VHVVFFFEKAARALLFIKIEEAKCILVLQSSNLYRPRTGKRKGSRQSKAALDRGFRWEAFSTKTPNHPHLCQAQRTTLNLTGKEQKHNDTSQQT